MLRAREPSKRAEARKIRSIREEKITKAVDFVISRGTSIPCGVKMFHLDPKWEVTLWRRVQTRRAQLEKEKRPLSDVPEVSPSKRREIEASETRNEMDLRQVDYFNILLVLIGVDSNPKRGM